MFLLLNSANLDIFVHLVAQAVKNLLSVRPEFDPLVGKIPKRRARQPTPVYICQESPNGHRSLTDYSPCGHKESDMTERLSTAQIQ